MIEALLIEHLHQNLTHVNLKAAALRRVAMHLGLTLVKNLAIRAHVQLVTVLIQMQDVQVVTVRHVVHVALLKFLL